MCGSEDSQVAPDEIELIGHLLVRAGTIMEDRAGEFISRLPADKPVIAGRIELLRRQANNWLH